MSSIYVCVLLPSADEVPQRDKGRICADIRGATLALCSVGHTPANRYYIFSLIRSLPMATFLVRCLILDCQVNAFCAPKEPRIASKASRGEIDTWLEKHVTDSAPCFVFLKH